MVVSDVSDLDFGNFCKQRFHCPACCTKICLMFIGDCGETARTGDLQYPACRYAGAKCDKFSAACHAGEITADCKQYCCNCEEQF